MSAQALKQNDNDNTMDVAGVGGKRLKAFLERIEVLLTQRSLIGAEIREIFAEAKGTGFEPKTMRTLIKLRAMNEDTRREEEELLDLYKTALGMLD